MVCLSKNKKKKKINKTLSKMRIQMKTNNYTAQPKYIKNKIKRKIEQ